MRAPLRRSKYIKEVLQLWGQEAEVMFASHHWIDDLSLRASLANKRVAQGLRIRGRSNRGDRGTRVAGMTYAALRKHG